MVYPSRSTKATGVSSSGSTTTDPIEDIARLLINRRDMALRRRVTQSGSRWYASKTNLTLPELAHALTGQGYLGLYALGIDGMSRWTGLDADDDAQFTRLLTYLQTLPDTKHIYVEESRRGGHVILFHQPVPWQTAAFTGEQLALEADLGKVDIFPHHAGLHALRCPGSRHIKTTEVYPSLDIQTGEVTDAVTALSQIQPIALPVMHFRMLEAPTGRSGHADPGAFDDLVSALSSLTRIRVYGPEKAIARCPWHDDRHPSLYIKGSRFSCLSSTCRIWGDQVDVKRWVERGILPPKN